MSSATPTLEEFNQNWIRPRELIDLMTQATDSSTAERYAIRRLKAGTYLARARTGPDRQGALRSFIQIDQRFWARLYDPPEEFWDIGDATFRVGGIAGYGDYTELEFLDVRFDPRCLSSDIPDGQEVLKDESQTTLIDAVPSPIEPPKNEPMHKIGNQDLKKVAKLIADLWGSEISDLEALARARRIFHENQIGEKRFLDEYRLNRPHKNRGPRPKNVD